MRVKEAFLSAGRAEIIYGLSGSGKHAVFSACYQAEPRPVVVVVHNREYLKAWRDDLLALLPTASVVELPETDVANIQQLPPAAIQEPEGWRRLDISPVRRRVLCWQK